MNMILFLLILTQFHFFTCLGSWHKVFYNANLTKNRVGIWIKQMKRLKCPSFIVKIL